MPSSPQRQIFWEIQKPTTEPPMHPLARDLSVDTVIVGGGMAGLQCAAMLREAGQDVLVLEGMRCGGGASGKTSGFITPDSELELSDFVRNCGAEKAKTLWNFVLGGVEAIRSSITTLHLDCDYQPQDSLFIANGKKEFSTVKHEYKVREALGYQSRLYDRSTISSAIGSEGYDGGVRYSGTFGMNSLAFCRGYAQQLAKRGVVICEASPVSKIHADGVTANGHRVRAQNVVVCTDRFLPALGIVPQQIYHAQTFLSISKPLPDADIRRLFPDERLMVWDTDLIYQYFRVTGDNRLLLGAASVLYTYDRTERQPPQRIIRKMEQYLHEKFPWLTCEMEYIWPGLIGVSKDFAPIAGRDDKRKNVFYVSGAAGLPWAAALGRYLAEKILHGRSDLDSNLRADRPYPVPSPVQHVLGKRLSFALSHGFAKYFR